MKWDTHLVQCTALRSLLYKSKGSCVSVGRVCHPSSILSSSKHQNIMYLTSLSLLLLWQSAQVFSHPLRARSPRRRAIGVSYDLTRAKAPISSSSSDETTSWGQLQDNAQRAKYLLPVEVEGQTFDLEIDTGSSDTWIIQTGFSCWDTYDGDANSFTGPESQSECNFGATYTPGYGYNTIADVYELSCYGQTETNRRCVSGPFGLASLSFAGYTVDNQVLGAPDLVCCQSPHPPECFLC